MHNILQYETLILITTFSALKNYVAHEVTRCNAVLMKMIDSIVLHNSNTQSDIFPTLKYINDFLGNLWHIQDKLGQECLLGMVR